MRRTYAPAGPTSDWKRREGPLSAATSNSREPCLRSLPQPAREVIEANLHCSEVRRRRRCVARPKRLISLARLIDLIDLIYLGEPALKVTDTHRDYNESVPTQPAALQASIAFHLLSFASALDRGATCSVGDSATLVWNRSVGVRRVGRVLLDAADEVERGVERFVILRIRWDVGLRAGLLVAFGLEVAAQRCLAARVGARFELLRNLLEHFDVGRDTLRLDRASGRGEVAPGGQPECRHPSSGSFRRNYLQSRPNFGAVSRSVAVTASGHAPGNRTALSSMFARRSLRCSART